MHRSQIPASALTGRICAADRHFSCAEICSKHEQYRFAFSRTSAYVNPSPTGPAKKNMPSSDNSTPPDPLPYSAGAGATGPGVCNRVIPTHNRGVTQPSLGHTESNDHPLMSHQACRNGGMLARCGRLMLTATSPTVTECLNVIAVALLV
jgi:hypothetical protein